MLKDVSEIVVTCDLRKKYYISVYDCFYYTTDIAYCLSCEVLDGYPASLGFPHVMDLPGKMFYFVIANCQG